MITVNLGNMWETEVIGNVRQWNMKVLRAIKEREEQEWRQALDTKPNFRLYAKLKERFKQEEYLNSYKRITEG